MPTDPTRSMKTVIRAIAPTYLKKSTDQADDLPDSQKVPIKVGKEYQILSYQLAPLGHYLVTLSHGAGQWYLYSGHWFLPWEDGKEGNDLPLIVKPPKRPILPPASWHQIQWTDMDAPVSRFFTVREVTNGDSRRVPLDPTIKSNIFQLAQELDWVREEWGLPIIVTSWYRPPVINRAVGGVSDSQHILGKAVDVRPASGYVLAFQEWLDKYAWKDKALGYGAKKGFVHLDLRPNPIRWNY